MTKTVLIVEDNLIHAQLMKDLLETIGLKAIHVARGGEAHAKARDCDPNLIIMDIRLPDVSGIKVTKDINGDGNLGSIPIVAVTAFASVADEKMMREAGCIDIITKPFEVQDFLGIVGRLTRSTHRDRDGTAQEELERDFSQ